MYINIITDATAHGLSSDSDKCILNFFFLKIFFKFFKELLLTVNLGAPEELFLTSISLNLIFLAEPTAFKKASLAANLFAKHSALFFLFSQTLISNFE